MAQKRRHGLEGYQIKHEFIDNPQAAEEAMNNLAYMIARGILEDEKKKAAQMAAMEG